MSRFTGIDHGRSSWLPTLQTVMNSFPLLWEALKHGFLKAESWTVRSLVIRVYCVSINSGVNCRSVIINMALRLYTVYV